MDPDTELRRRLDATPAFRRAYAAYTAYLEQEGLPRRSIILCGHPKSGNTFIRFVYHNLIAVARGGAAETMTYARLNEVQINRDFPHSFMRGTFEPPPSISIIAAFP